ncbi:ferredoxin reductase-like protein [Rhizophagus irregularis]|uniref:Ferredoxin reductase-like protein n=1 Tax=Rhizophagus irregularis TaxID=588596 RepID=A0A2N0PA23_9GLOM|nr:ferredoxin reductase-like protein [Rhizophagus irregularis]
MSQRAKFRRYKLTSRSTVNNSKKFPVVKFTFTRVFQDEKDCWDEAFLPGQYIEIKSRIKGQVIVRSYTPIQGRLSKSFYIYVKIYPNGLMSTHLVPISSTFPTSPTKSSLINSDSVDGRWEELFMICGGTGISPMLQVQSESVEERDRKTRMYLLYGNREIDDVIDSNALREYERSSRGMLEIIYVFSVPPPNESNELSYLQGSITSDIIQNSFPKYGSARNTKIAVCGPPEMMLNVKQTLTDMGYSEREYILLI